MLSYAQGTLNSKCSFEHRFARWVLVSKLCSALPGHYYCFLPVSGSPHNATRKYLTCHLPTYQLTHKTHFQDADDDPSLYLPVYFPRSLPPSLNNDCPWQRNNAVERGDLA